jgi:hypothetical protein
MKAKRKPLARRAKLIDPFIENPFAGVETQPRLLNRRPAASINPRAWCKADWCDAEATIIRNRAMRWTYWQVVSWIVYRCPLNLDKLLLHPPRHFSWYDRPDFRADQELRRAFEHGVVKAYDASGNEIGPLALLPRDPQRISFYSAKIKALWPSMCGHIEHALKKSTRGRPATYNWEGVKGKLLDYARKSGSVESQNELLQMCADFAATLHPTGMTPNDSTIRDAIKKHGLETAARGISGK